MGVLNNLCPTWTQSAPCDISDPKRIEVYVGFLSQPVPAMGRFDLYCHEMSSSLLGTKAGLQHHFTCREPPGSDRPSPKRAEGCGEWYQQSCYHSERQSGQGGTSDLLRWRLWPQANPPRAWAWLKSKWFESLILIMAHIRKQETWFKSLILILFYICTFMFIFLKRDWF